MNLRKAGTVGPKMEKAHKELIELLLQREKDDAAKNP